MIDSDEKLSEFLVRLRQSAWVALDTEADSLHAYPEKLCLLQITTPSGDELIDPLTRINLEPLLAALTQHELIMHGSDYDLRLFRKHYAFAPNTIFDTMLASRLLGIMQFGLTNLVSQFLGVTLDKGSQKADWAKRPLTERMEVYARNDTHYLKPLSDQLRAALIAKGRLEWHRESCARLVDDCARPPEIDHDNLWRIKGSNRLSRPAMAVLRELWHWREREAIAANRPPFFVLSHETMLDLAVAASLDRPLDTILPRRISDRRRQTMLDAIAAGLAVPVQDQPHALRLVGRRTTDAEKRRSLELQKRRDAVALELGIDPTVIASRGMLMQLAEDWDRACGTVLMKWQYELLK